MKHKFNDIKEVWGQSDYNYGIYNVVIFFAKLRFTIFYIFGVKNKSLSLLKNKDFNNKIIPVWRSSVYPINYDPPEPAYDHFIVAENWLVFGYNEEQVS